MLARTENTNAGFFGIKAIFFDVYNTIARFWPPREEIQSQACQSFDISVTSHGIAAGYASADEFMARENAGNRPLRMKNVEETKEFFAKYEQLILKGAGFDADLVLCSLIWDRVRQIPYSMAIFEDVIPALIRLRSFGLIVGVISNVRGNSSELTDSLGLTSYLDVAVTSGEVGMEKPHPPVFLEALRRAAVTPEKSVHVGDQYTSDVLGARNVGIHPILLDRYGVSLHPEDVITVNSMEAVVSIMEEAWKRSPS
ncbi:HAD-IA family hydrolase [SAR202 cluster bacterium AD-802-E10_MRT_200m]|nr:HAD-IA family hydrolase [SAR202 cluster bacterium AD-802-E10_MRT_200m]MQF82942.1 HAD-IA family hydrolase [SAR202 cluster bacterium AD-802-E10_MRT_200m]